MVKFSFASAFISLSLLCCTSAAGAAEKEITLTSLEWPPYSSSTRFGGGTTTSIIRSALAKEGYTLKVEFEPWETAVSRAVSGEVSGYFPEYYSASLESQCVFSEPAGTSLVVYAHRAGETMPSTSLSDLDQTRVGVVSGYVNEDKLDQAIADGKVPSVAAATDEENLQNLGNGIVDLAVIDRRVMGYWLYNDPALKPLADKLEFDPAGLKLHGLYVCFTGPDARQHADILNRGLKAADPMGFGIKNDPMYRKIQ